MRRTLSSLVALLAVGCTWVSQKQYEDVRDQLDEDGDGALFKDDCDDQDPLRGAGAEVPYDAIDNDCSLGKDEFVDPSDVDADGDGYAGISQEAYEAAAKDARSPLDYPAIFVGRELDCDDADSAVNPGRAPQDDTAYDGVDTNCDGALDFDRDGDGYFANYDGTGNAITQEDVDAFVARYGFDAAHVAAWGPGGSGGPVPGDCEDGAEQYFPGSALEVPYSQFDEDCDGSDDFDQDGDGHIPPGTEDAWDNWQARYFLDTPVKPADDCADGPDMPEIAPGVPYRPLLDLATAATVNPDATDTWYDGIDSDCDGADDFDQDLDGYIETSNVSARTAFVDAWGYEDEPWADGPSGDCDDTDASFRPGLLDTLWTDEDEDCDGLVDLSYLNFGDGGNVASATACPVNIGGNGTVCWLQPSNPELLWFDDSQFALFVSAEEYSAPADVQHLAGASFQFDAADAVGAAVPTQMDGRSWFRSFPIGAPQVLSPFIDLAEDAVPGSAKCITGGGAVGDVCSWLMAGGYGEGGNGEINSAVVYANNNQFATQPQARGITRDPMTVLHVDAASFESGVSDLAAFVQCGPERLHGKLASLATSYESTSFPGDVCFFYKQPTDTEQLVEVCDGGSCQVVQFTLAGQTFTARGDINVSADDWAWADREYFATLLVDGSGHAFVRDDGPAPTAPGAEWAVFEASGSLPLEQIEQFDLVADGGEIWLAGLTTDGRVLLERRDGPVDPQLDRIELTVTDPSNPTYVPTAVGIAVGPDQVGVAVTLTDPADPVPSRGSVGWTFLGRP